MPETARDIFSDMKDTIHEVLLTQWQPYITTVTAAYDTAFKSVEDLLADTKAKITARQQKEQALMVATLSILTGGVVGVMADGLIKRLPALERTMTNDMGDVITIAQEDTVLYKVFRDTTKDLAKKGMNLPISGLEDKFQGSPPSSGFRPVGMSVEDYRDQLTQGFADRARFLWNFAQMLYRTADVWTPQQADSLRQGLYNNDFFTNTQRVAKPTLVKQGKLALWCAWALARDEDYWQRVEALKNYNDFSTTAETRDFSSVRDELVSLGVPADPITISSWERGMIHSDLVNGLNVYGFMQWVKQGGMTRTLFNGIHVEGEARHQAKIDAQKLFGQFYWWGTGGDN